MRKKRRKKFKQPSLKADPRVIWTAAFLIFIGIILATIGLAIYKSDIFLVKKENIDSSIALNESWKSKIVNKSLFDLDLKELSSSILKEHPEFKEVHVIKKFPSGIAVEIKKRIPLAQIKRRLFYPIDREAIILDDGQKAPYPGLIIIEIDNYANLLAKGKNVNDDNLKYAFKLVEILKDQKKVRDFKITTINVNNIQAIYFLVELIGDDQPNPLEVKVIVGQSDLKRKLDILDNILKEELRDKLSLISYIDLRYKEAYVGFKR